MRLSLLADQLGSQAGGGRFTVGYLRAVGSNLLLKANVERVSVILSEGEPIDSILPLPSNTRVTRRRFPSRLRSTPLAGLVGQLCPRADVAHGLFYYVFPGQARRSLITVHDVSFLNKHFHKDSSGAQRDLEFMKAAQRSDVVVCSSESTLSELIGQWPELAERCVCIYPGASGLHQQCLEPSTRATAIRSQYILAVGTVEPRKNYASLLTAYEALLSKLGVQAPSLVIAGRQGWMQEDVVRQLMGLERTGKVHWVRDASDEQLSSLYHGASVFTYLSIYEGFGYPPFEAAHAGKPMVVSSASSVGEIWSGHAHTVDPTDVGQIMSGWEWALKLTESERAAIVRRQRFRAKQFSWERCVASYMALYSQLAELPAQAR